MGICSSSISCFNRNSIKNSYNDDNNDYYNKTTSTAKRNRDQNSKAESAVATPAAATATMPMTAHNKQPRRNEDKKNQNQRTKEKASRRRKRGHVASEKQTDLGHEKYFHSRSSAGELMLLN